MDTEYTWTPPHYHVSQPPALISSVSLPPNSEFPDDYVRSAKWCPDGSTALAQSENRTFHFLNLPAELLGTSLSHVTTIPETVYTSFTRPLPQPSPILDFAWYPQATVQDPASFCFVASVRDAPVRLVDAGDGRLRASYKIVDHRERQVAPHSLAFSPSANKLYCGFDSAIEIFDVHRPGEGNRLLTSPNKKSRDGMKGIISSLAFSLSSPTSFYAAGTLSPTLSPIALYDASVDEAVMYLGIGDSERRRVSGGVTQLHFNPMKPHMLYASFRRCGSIYAWDLRGGSADGEPLYKYRFVQSDLSGMQDEKMTNQRLRFDIDIGGQWLGIGNQTGDVSLFDLHHGINVDAGNEPANELASVQEYGPTLTFRAHADAIGSVSFHPLHPLLLSVSGSRHFALPSSNSSSESEDSGKSDGSSIDEQCLDQKSTVNSARSGLYGPWPYSLDNSVKMWTFGGDRDVDR